MMTRKKFIKPSSISALAIGSGYTAGKFLLAITID
jgi:hypothetical protein